MEEEKVEFKMVAVLICEEREGRSVLRLVVTFLHDSKRKKQDFSQFSSSVPFFFFPQVLFN